MACPLRYRVEKYGTAIQATDDSMVHALRGLDAQSYRRTIRICNTSSFPQQLWLCERA
jgi:hypothetical protein